MSNNTLNVEVIENDLFENIDIYKEVLNKTKRLQIMYDMWCTSLGNVK